MTIILIALEWTLVTHTDFGKARTFGGTANFTAGVSTFVGTNSFGAGTQFAEWTII